MKKILVLIGMVTLCFCSKAEALLIQVDNIGSDNIGGMVLNFETPPYGDQTNFQISSYQYIKNYTNAYFPDSFNYFPPLHPGESFQTYAIPELSGSDFRLVGGQVNSDSWWGWVPRVYMNPNEVATIEYAPGDFFIEPNLGVRFTFRPGGAPVPGTPSTPVPEPTTLSIMSLGLAGFVVKKIGKAKR